MFQAHQRLRQQQGLPPERGLQARLYAAIAETADLLDWPLLVLFAWLLMGILFDASVLLCAGVAPQ